MDEGNGHKTVLCWTETGANLNESFPSNLHTLSGVNPDPYTETMPENGAVNRSGRISAIIAGEYTKTVIVLCNVTRSFNSRVTFEVFCNKIELQRIDVELKNDAFVTILPNRQDTLKIGTANADDNRRMNWVSTPAIAVAGTNWISAGVECE